LVVEFADGRQEHHRLDQVARFVTEDANPGNRLGVARVTAPAAYPAAGCRGAPSRHSRGRIGA
jgi:hypothetical protein